MYTHDPDPSKRIPKSLGTEATLIGNYTLADAAVALVPAVIVILAFQLVIPPGLVVGGYAVDSLTLPLVAVAMLCGLAFVYVTPAYTSSFDWLTSILAYYQRDRTNDHDGAKQHTRIERIHPRENAIERVDGSLIGFVQVDPPSMALATDTEWHEKAQDFRTFLDTVVEFPIQLYATTQDFPAEEYLSHYERRLEDGDVKGNPRLKRLIEEYVAWYGRELDARRMTIRDHYVIVQVAPGDVQFSRETVAQKLTRVPMLGLFIEVFFGLDVNEQRAVLFETLDRRLRRVEMGIRDIDGCHAQRIPATEAARIIAEYWHGRALAYGDLESVVRTRPLVDGRSR